MPIYTLREYQEGKVLCAYCEQPITDPMEAMRYKPTDQLYHERPCFQYALEAQLEADGLDTSGMPLELTDIINDLFGIQRKKGTEDGK